MKYRLLTTVAVLALCVFTVQAQSGRRHTLPEPAAPVPTPTPEPSPTPKNAEEKSELIFFIGADRNDSFATFPFTYYDAVVSGCANRLRMGSSADIDASNQSLSRGDAIKKAKTDTKTYVVLLMLKFDTMARSYDDMIVEFVVFAPGTAKVAVTGRSYMNANRAGPIIAQPRGSTSALYREQMLKLAGEDAGNRILKSLHLDVSIPKKP
ncbi:MAG TPA: hypothetical protein VN724_08745 [Pyrinomonadaceae bacterium]|jgi:hypothetical protein|nr:hypothetical protein [Pyrinomonadaceae bacterium]